MNTKAIVLFGHGARDIRWREPFDSLAALWKAQHPNVLVELAFLELMQPSLEEAIATNLAGGASEVIVVPVFFGQGGHLRNDFPVLLSTCQKKFPNIALRATAAVGEDELVLQSIVDFAARQSMQGLGILMYSAQMGATLEMVMTLIVGSVWISQLELDDLDKHRWRVDKQDKIL